MNDAVNEACHPRFLPRLGWRRSADEFGVGQALPNDGAQRLNEPRSIVSPAVVEPERFFVDVPEQVERLNTNVGSVNRPLQECPKILNPVGVNRSIDVFLRMVNRGMKVVQCESPIRRQGVRVDSRTARGMLLNELLQGPTTGVLNHACAYDAVTWASVTAQDTDDDCLTCSAGSLDNTVSAVLVHVPSLAADVSLVNLMGTVGLLEGSGLHGEPDAVEHEPRGFLSDAKRPRHFVRTDAVLVVDQHPHRGEPLAQADRAILEDRSHFGGELALGVLRLALPAMLIREELDFEVPAVGASNTVRPTQRNHERQTAILVREVFDGFE